MGNSWKYDREYKNKSHAQSRARNIRRAGGLARVMKERREMYGHKYSRHVVYWNQNRARRRQVRRKKSILKSIFG